MLWWTLRQLKSKNPEKRKRAAEKLGGSKDKRAVDLLVAALDDADSDVQKASAKALGMIGDVRAVGPLTRAFGHACSADIWEMRSATTEALVKLGNASVEPLIAMLKGAWFGKFAAASVLVEIGSAAVEPLIDVFKDANVNERRVAAEALGKIGDMRAVEPLLAALIDSGYVWEVGKALQSLQWQPMDDTQKVHFAIALGEWDKVASFGAAAVDPLLVALKNGSTLGGAAIALGKIGDARAMEPLLAALTHEYGWVRTEVVEALGQIGDARAVKPLVAALRGLTRSEHEDAIANALVKIGAASTVDLLVAALKDSDYRLRAAAAKVLGKIGDARATESLVAALKDGDDNVRHAVVNALGHIGDPQAVESLVAILEDTIWYMRAAAAQALGKIRDGRAAESLVAAFKDSVENVRRAAADALVEIGSAAIDPLLAEIKDCHSSVQDMAVRILGQIGDASAVTRAVEMLMAVLTDHNSQARKTAANLLQLLNWQPVDDAQRALLAVALEEWDKAVCIGTVAVEPLIATLGCNARRVRSAAAAALQSLNWQPVDDYQRALLVVAREEFDNAVSIGEAAVEPLGTVLKDENSWLYKTAVDALGKVGGERAFELLLTLLTHHVVHGDAAEALNKIDPNWAKSETAKAAVPSLVAALKEQHGGYYREGTRLTVIAALERIGDTRAIEPMVAELINEGYLTVRKRAAEALGQIGNARIVNPLVVAAFKEVMVMYENNDNTALRGSMKDGGNIRRAMVDVLDKIDPNWTQSEEAKAAIPSLLTVLGEGNIFARKAAAEMLGEIGESRAIDQLVAALDDEDSDMRSAAAKALGKIGGTQAIKRLVSVIIEKVYVPRSVEDALVRIDPNWAKTEEAKAAIPSLLAALKSGGVDARGEAARVLGETGDAGAVEPLIALFGTDWPGYEFNSRYIWESLKSTWGKVIEALVKIGDAAINPLVASLADEHLFHQSVEALVKIGDAAIEPLVAALNHENILIRMNAAKVLGKIGDRRTVESLAAALNDENEYVRTTVALALAGFKDKRAVKHLIATLNNECRDDAIRALGQIGDARAVMPLAELISNTYNSSQTTTVLITIHELERLIDRCATQIASSDLHKIANLDGVSVVGYDYDRCGNSITIREQITCWSLRQLARQELIRRGLEA